MNEEISDSSHSADPWEAMLLALEERSPNKKGDYRLDTANELCSGIVAHGAVKDAFDASNALYDESKAHSGRNFYQPLSLHPDLFDSRNESVLSPETNHRDTANHTNAPLFSMVKTLPSASYVVSVKPRLQIKDYPG